MVKRAKKVPRFKSEDQERDFWSEADSTDYVEWSEARPLVLPNLKPSLKTISLRLPEHMLAERLEEELQRIGPAETKT